MPTLTLIPTPKTKTAPLSLRPSIRTSPTTLAPPRRKKSAVFTRMGDVEEAKTADSTTLQSVRNLENLEASQTTQMAVMASVKPSIQMHVEIHSVTGLVPSKNAGSTTSRELNS